MKKPVLNYVAGMVGACILASAQADPVTAVTVAGAYARAVAPGQANSAAYMVLKNTGTKEESLTAAESPVAKKVELHTHLMQDGMMKMREIKEIEIPAGKEVTLQPGGLHIMLIGLTHQLVPGEEVPLTLIFEDGEHQTIKMPVRGVEGPTEAEHHHHMH